MRQQTGKVTAQLKLKTLNDNPYLLCLITRYRCLLQFILLPVLLSRYVNDGRFYIEIT
jgi:hypothetical protein